MLKILRLVDGRLAKVESGLAVALYILLLLTVTLKVAARNLFQTGSFRLLELAPMLVLWLALVGATLALKNGRHIKIKLLLRLLPQTWRRIGVVLTSLFGLTVSALLFYSAVIFVFNEIILFGAQGWFAICFPLFFLVSLIRFGVRLLGQWPWHRQAGQ